jgi:hypothetical protein
MVGDQTVTTPSKEARPPGRLSIGLIFGFEIRIDYSWFIIFFLILWIVTSDDREAPSACTPSSWRGSRSMAEFASHVPVASRFLHRPSWSPWPHWPPLFRP